MTATREPLADQLIRLRQEAGLSLRQLEATSGVSRSIISRLESGERQQPTPSTLIRLAKALDAEAADLLTTAGYAASAAEALPALGPYLRTKYGYLSAADRQSLANSVEEVLEHLEEEQRTKRVARQQSS